MIFPNVPEASVDALRKEPIFGKYEIDPGNLTRGMVSCTGAQVRGLLGRCWHAAVASRARSKVGEVPRRLQTFREHDCGHRVCASAQVVGLPARVARQDAAAPSLMPTVACRKLCTVLFVRCRCHAPMHPCSCGEHKSAWILTDQTACPPVCGLRLAPRGVEQRPRKEAPACWRPVSALSDRRARRVHAACARDRRGAPSAS